MSLPLTFTKEIANDDIKDIENLNDLNNGRDVKDIIDIRDVKDVKELNNIIDNKNVKNTSNKSDNKGTTIELKADKLNNLISINKQIIRMPIFWFEDENPITITKISEEHPLYLIENFITKQDCEWIINYGKSKLYPSTTLEGKTLLVTHNRTSTTAHLTTSGQISSESVLYGLQMKVTALSWYPIQNIESINLTHYDAGQFFKPHHDYFDPVLNKGMMGKPGQRICTFFVYLNDVPEEDGGATNFPYLNISVQPKCGSCLFWLNTSSDGNIVYENTMHEGAKLSRGEKWGLNIWIRQNSF